MIVFPGDYVLHEGIVQRVVDTDGDMMVKLTTGKWIIADESAIDGLRSEPEMIKFLELEAS